MWPMVSGHFLMQTPSIKTCLRRAVARLLVAVPDGSAWDSNFQELSDIIIPECVECTLSAIIFRQWKHKAWLYDGPKNIHLLIFAQSEKSLDVIQVTHCSWVHLKQCCKVFRQRYFIVLCKRPLNAGNKIIQREWWGRLCQPLQKGPWYEWEPTINAAEVKYLTYLAVVSFTLSILLQVSKVSATSHSSGQPQSHSHCTIVLTGCWNPHDDVELIGIRLVQKVTRQFIHDG